MVWGQDGVWSPDDPVEGALGEGVIENIAKANNHLAFMTYQKPWFKVLPIPAEDSINTYDILQILHLYPSATTSGTNNLLIAMNNHWFIYNILR